MAEATEAKEIDADLQQLIERWPKLPDAIRKKILLLGQGQQENVKLTWGPLGYERTVVDGKGGGIECAVDDQYEKR
jgi:hypothetical protein